MPVYDDNFRSSPRSVGIDDFQEDEYYVNREEDFEGSADGGQYHYNDDDDDGSDDPEENVDLTEPPPGLVQDHQDQYNK